MLDKQAIVNFSNADRQLLVDMPPPITNEEALNIYIKIFGDKRLNNRTIHHASKELLQQLYTSKTPWDKLTSYQLSLIQLSVIYLSTKSVNNSVDKSRSCSNDADSEQ